MLGGLNVTTGNISALAGPENNSARIQFTAPVQHGNSGGHCWTEPEGSWASRPHYLDWHATLAQGADLPQNVNFAVRKETITTFLSTQGARTAETPPLSQDKSVADVAEAAKNSLFRVECREPADAADSASPNQDQRFVAPKTVSTLPVTTNMEGAARRFIGTISEALGMEPNHALGTLNSLYDERVSYFDKNFSKAKILAD